MEIIFSRHAKRRARLYRIEQQLVVDILQASELTEGENLIVWQRPPPEYPLKIVAAKQGDQVTIITNYPLKKARGS